MKKRVIRQRTWTGEKAEAGRVGENLRDVQSFVESFPMLRIVAVEDAVLPAGGYIFSHPQTPEAVLCIYAENADGTLPTVTSALTSWKYNGEAVTATVSGLVPGTRYAIVRLLVIG